MASETYGRPPEPLVEHNVYRSREMTRTPIPSFQDVRNRLPVPVLPEHELYREMYWRAWEMAWVHLRRPSAENGFVANYIDPAFNDHIFMWDSVFMTQFGIYGRRAFDFMATLDNFYTKQHADGYICREITSDNGRDYFTPFDPDGTGPNIMAWGEWRHYRITGNDSRLQTVFRPLLAYHRWMRANRSWQSGLYWATGLSSGMDNQPRVPDSSRFHRHWSWVDASMQAALNCTILLHMAQLLEEQAFIQELEDERETLRRLINERMWNSAAAFYQDIDRDGRFSPVKSIGAYWGLLDADMLQKERWEPFVRHLRDSWAFKLPHRVPSQSADSEGYNAETGHYWRGGVWSPTNYMVMKGLHAIGQQFLAHEIAINHLDNIGEVYRHTDTFWENYAPETAVPGNPARPNFVGWTGLAPIAMLLEDVIGIWVDWPQRRVTWHRHLDSIQHYGVHNYPLGSGGTLDLLGNQEQVVVTTDVPFTLMIRDRVQSVQVAVPAGTTEIDLA